MNGNDALSDPFPPQWYQSMVVDTGDAPARLAVKTTGDNSAVFTLAADRAR